MNQRPGQRAPAHYELRIEGHLDERWSAWFGGLTLIPEDDGTTTLRGAVTDQAELHGLLAKVRDLGAILISVNTIDAPGRGDKGAIPPLLAPGKMSFRDRGNPESFTPAAASRHRLRATQGRWARLE